MKPRLLAAVTVLWMGTCLAGCNPAGDSLYRMFQHDDPAVRMRAAIRSGQAKDPNAVGYLVDRLTDSEPEVRFFSILALEKITGTRLGYEYYAGPAARAEAVQRWRDRLKADRQAGPTTQRTEAAKEPTTAALKQQRTAATASKEGASP